MSKSYSLVLALHHTWALPHPQTGSCCARDPMGSSHLGVSHEEELLLSEAEALASPAQVVSVGNRLAYLGTTALDVEWLK